MTNLAATPTAWQNESGLSPPSWWTGTAYVCDDTGRLGIGTVMTLIAAPNAGDTFEVTFQNFAAPNPVGTSSDVSLYDGNGNQLATWDLTTPNGPSDSTYTFDGTEGLAYLQAETISSGTPHTTYQADFSFTPSQTTVEAQDTSISVKEQSQANQLPTSVLINGSIGEPDSIAVMSGPNNGSLTQDGLQLLYTPNDSYVGSDVVSYTATSGGTTSDPANINITVYPIPCVELGRVTREFVSGFYRDRVHVSRIYRGEKRCLVANFNGAVSSARSIVSARWSTWNPYYCALTRAEVTGRETSCLLSAQFDGETIIRCIATFDNFEEYTQFFRVVVLSSPWFKSDTNQSQGPYEIVAYPQGT